MVQEGVTKVTLESFRERSSGKKVVLLYPWTNYRTLFLTYYYENTQDGLLYYRITEDQTSLTLWLGGLVQELEKLNGSFGDATKTALQSRKKAAQLGEALAYDLAAIQAKQTILYIDELDRIPFDNEFNKFIAHLVAALPAHVQLVFNSRMLMHQPWYDLIARGEAAVLGTERRKDNGMFTLEKQANPQLEVYALGTGYTLVNGQIVDNWDGALPRNLFFFFMDRPLVTRKEIFETFWPELPVKEATNVFHVTKRKISERISLKIDTQKTYEMTQYASGFYTPGKKLTRHYDVFDFQSDVEQAMISSEDKEEELLLRAVECYRSPFLQDTDMPWITQRRDQLRLLNAQALISLGRIYKRRNDLDNALGYFSRSLAHTPEREDIYREMMMIYHKTGRKQEAILQYRQLAEMLRSVYKINPSRETQDLHHLIESS
ncbi:MAG: bacterial transcriptional activator domain-containing protein [Chloroflexi bacterium]|nr:bacterial transcriptional activator domain-containing protein [Chloroflexota bacterium]MCC6892965.1 bacterial transcriptional activator domain-containing protein [Anaerolineae bacterium]